MLVSPCEPALHPVLLPHSHAPSRCDEAEEAGLKSAQVGDGPARCVIIYKEGWSPPELLELEVCGAWWHWSPQ